MRPIGGSVPADVSSALTELRAGSTSLALALYGSVARGTSDTGSDVDVLEIVEREPQSYRRGEINVTQYTPAHLHALAQRGSLFVLHLAKDAIVLQDPFGVWQAALDAYEDPPDYESVKQQLRILSGAITMDAEDLGKYVKPLARLGLYALRTAVYVAAVESGRTTFDIEQAAAFVSVPGLAEVLRMRRRSEFSKDDLSRIKQALDAVLPGNAVYPAQQVAAYAVAHSTSPDLSALFASLFLDSGEIAYSTLSLPPF